MRSSLILASMLALAATGCDRQTPEAAQPDAGPGADAATTEAGSVAGEGKAGASGLNGRLDIASRGTPAPDLAFADPQGQPVRLADFRGRPVLVNLWATWCAPCVVEMPTLDALAAREKDRLVVLTVSQDLQGAEVVDRFWADKGWPNLAPYTDPENGLGFHYGEGLLPTTVLYDAQGREVWRMIGGMEWDGARARNLLEETLASQ